MIIGIGREIKTDETRVGLLPEHIKILSAAGHKVLVERGAGEKAGFSDREYIKSGADAVSKERLYRDSGMIVKVKCPLPGEYGYLSDGQILCTFLHFDENISPENIQKMVSRGITGIAYEWVEEKGDYPLLRPMSELTGILFALQSMRLLMEKKGMLPGGFLEGAAPPSAVITGMGRIGTNALKVFLMNNMKVTVIEKFTESIEERALRYIDRSLWQNTRDKRKIIGFDSERPENTVHLLEELTSRCDIALNCAVRGADLPKSKMEYLITKEMVAKMKKGSVICDATACDRDMVETAVPSEKLNEVYEVDGVVHYNCDHIPALVPKTSSAMLAKNLFPYIKTLADAGFEKAVREKPSLFNAVMCHKGLLTHRLTALKKNMDCKALNDILQ